MEGSLGAEGGSGLCDARCGTKPVVGARVEAEGFGVSLPDVGVAAECGAVHRWVHLVKT